MINENTADSILIADRQPEVSRILMDFLVQIGYRADTANTSQEVLSKAAVHDYAAILVDCRLSPDSGLDLLTRLSSSHPETSIVMLSADPSLEQVIAAMHQGVFDFIVKPVDFERLRSITRRACEQHELTKMHQAMRAQMRPSGNVTSDARRRGQDSTGACAQPRHVESNVDGGHKA